MITSASVAEAPSFVNDCEQCHSDARETTRGTGILQRQGRQGFDTDERCMHQSAGGPDMDTGARILGESREAIVSRPQ